MIPILLRRLLCVSVLLVAPTGALTSAAAADLDVYRDFKLGHSTAVVLERARGIARDVKTLHERPMLLQELSWRPPYITGGGMSGRDTVRAVVFSFMNDKLFRIAVEYEARQTEGMTSADMTAALTAVYGQVAPAAPAVRRPTASRIDALVPVARWQKGDTEVVLLRSEIGSRFSMTIASVSGEQRARKAQSDGDALHKSEAPAREAAQAKARADAADKAAEATRATNKAAFKP